MISFGKFELVLSYLRLFQKSQVIKPKQQTCAGKNTWIPYPLDSYKTNFNGAVFEDSFETGIGVVIRNSADEIIAAMSEKISMPPSVVILESLAARQAVLFAHEVGITKSSFEGDSEIVTS